MLDLFGRLFELSGGTLSVELHDVVANDEHGVALFALRAARDGRQLEDNEVLVFHPSQDGKAAEIWTPAALTAAKIFGTVSTWLTWRSSSLHRGQLDSRKNLGAFKSTGSAHEQWAADHTAAVESVAPM